jgi:undecaprenyl-diphosphatase
MLVNFSLKVTFQVPLLPTAGKVGFAFPSGHMQSSVVLYGWLITKTKNIFYQVLIVGLLISIGFSLVHKGYHDYADVLAGIFFGVILIRGFMHLTNHNDKIITWILCSISTLLMFYIAKIYTIESHVWMAYYGLIGLVFSEQCFVKHQKDESLYCKLLATFFCFMSIFGVKMLFATSVFSALPMFLKQLEWALIGFCIPCTRWVPSRIIY